MTRGRPAEIAIIGLDCRFAGASGATAFFENILAGKDSTRQVPPDRWNPATFCDPGSSAIDRVPTCRGGYLDSPLAFDAAAHGIMPRTVDGGEPEQFLILEVATAALADARLDLARLADHRVEVVIGRGNYFNRGNLTRLEHGRMIAQTVALLHALHPEWSPEERQKIADDLRSSLPPFEAATIPGQLTNATAGRLAHRFDLRGSSFVVDAASASSLVALDLAMRALRSRRASLAIVGGVYLEADVDFPLVFRQLGALSRSGTARPFGATADGMLPGEGVGVVILKRLRDAERDGDRIYALVQGVGVASDGRSQGLAAPSARGHARAMRLAYRLSGIDPATVALVEGHGLGVPAADRAELRALRAVFPAPAHGHRFLGAVSSMIGHAMPASGIAGLIKTALALFHRVLPPTLHAEQPHPLLDRPDSPFKLNPSSRPWIHGLPDSPRRAGVNAFGFAGINAHAVLEEHSASADGDSPGALRTWDTEAILLWAPDRTGLIERTRELIDWVSLHRSGTLRDVAFTSNSLANHERGGARLGIVASSLPELSDRLSAALVRLTDPACRFIRDARGVYFWQEPLYRSGGKSLAFLFPGEGSQYPGMMADLCIHFPVVRKLFDTADRLARDLGDQVPPSEYLFAHAVEHDEKLWSPATAVNVVLNAQWAMYQLLTRLGLGADAVVGHSSGELLALSAAGVFPADRALEQKLAGLGSIFRNFESLGDLPEAHLVAVAADRGRVEAICRAAGIDGTAVAMDNCPHQVVLAVPSSEFERLVARLRAASILWEDLPFSRAYHTPDFEPVVAPIAEFFDGMKFSLPRVPIYSCASARLMPADLSSIRDLAVEQWTTTVAFRETIEAMHADGLRLFVDVGARGNLAGFVEDILRGKPSFAVAANLPRRSGLAQLNHLLASLFAHDVPLNLDLLYARRRPRAIDWNAPEPPARTTVELSLGFPEMRFSDTLVASLRKPPLGHPTPGYNGDESFTPEGPFPVAHPHRTQNGNGNGTSRHNQAELPPAAIRSHALPRFDSVQELIPNSAPPSSYQDRLAEISETIHELSSPAEKAMLSFQQTMQAFLQTQQEIMTTYLEASADTLTESFADPGEAVTHALIPLERELTWGNLAHGPRSGSGGRVTAGSHPGPWAGELRRLVPGQEIETLVILSAHDDPIAHHHTLGGRKVSALDPSLKGLPVLPFAVMAEMTAQAAALAVTPGLVLTGLTQVRAHKWVRFEDEPVYLELHGRRAPSSDDERFWVGIFNRGSLGKSEAVRPVFEAIVIFDVATPGSPPQSDWSLADPRKSKFTARSVYEEQWLFHGPPLQAVSHVGELARDGIEGRIRVLPWAPLVKDGEPPLFHTDFIVLDNFTHLLGCWGLDYLSEGDVVFPLSMDELEIFGDRPVEGTDLSCRITVNEIERHRLRVESEIIRPDGSVWMRIRDWEDWRFHWPGRYRDVMRQPRDFLLGEELSLRVPGDLPVAAAKAVWLEPPADMGRPVWRDVLEQIQLAPNERAAVLASVTGERHRAHELWGRIAAKEAARRLWLEAGGPPVYPADLAVMAGPRGRLQLFSLATLADPAAAVSIAYSEGVAVALAAADPHARIGIDVKTIVAAPHALEAAMTPGEQCLLSRWIPADRAEWITRFQCAKEAAAKAIGVAKAPVDNPTPLSPRERAGVRAPAETTTSTPNSLSPRERAGVRAPTETSARAPLTCEITQVDAASGIMQLTLAPQADQSLEASAVESLYVASQRRGDYVWAWTLLEGADS
jgi:acyl transferase domain-containing protein